MKYVSEIFHFNDPVSAVLGTYLSVGSAFSAFALELDLSHPTDPITSLYLAKGLAYSTAAVIATFGLAKGVDHLLFMPETQHAEDYNQMKLDFD